MITFEIMDHHGHTTLEFDETNAAELALGQQKFDELINSGKRAAVRTEDGNHEFVDKFDKENEEVLFMPQLVGG